MNPSSTECIRSFLVFFNDETLSLILGFEQKQTTIKPLYNVCVIQQINQRNMIKAVKNFYQKHNLRPFESTWLMGVHIMGVLGLIYALSEPSLLAKILLTHCIFHNIWALGITAGAHRLWSHKSYKASTLWKTVIMLLNSGANQGSIFHWSRDHRLHHKYSDTQLDPHTISKGFFFAHVGWLLVKKSPRMVEEGRKIDMSDLEKDPVVMFQKKHYLPLSMTMCFVIPTLIYYFIVGTSFLGGYLLAFTAYATMLNATWMVNSICHMFGSRPYNSKIEPTDNFWVSLVTAGEGYHNWHHEYPSDWKASKDDWWMINITARLIEFGSLFKLTSVKTF